MDLRAQRRVEFIFLDADDLGLCAICQSRSKGKSVPHLDAGILCAGIDEQVHGSDPAVRSAPVRLLATKPLDPNSLAELDCGESATVFYDHRHVRSRVCC